MTTPTVIVIGPQPEPLHGQSRVTQIISSALQARCHVYIGDTSPGSLQRSVHYHRRKLVKVCKVLIALIRHSRKPRRRAYISADSGLGLLYTALFSGLARLLNYKIFLHHHSFSYISQPMVLMKCAAFAAGYRATHIFLCQCMAEQFRDHYAAGDDLLVSNARFVQPLTELPDRDDSSKLRIGLLSNLSPAKGLSDFIDLVHRIAQHELPIEAVLAGPAATEFDRSTIAQATHELHALNYRGPVYGEDKERFYQDIDVFLFPTRYPIEAQPNVIFEALAFGVPVIAFDRGCIGSDVDYDSGLVMPKGADFSAAALAQLEAWLQQPDVFMQARQAALQRAHQLHQLSQTGFDRMLTALST